MLFSVCMLQRPQCRLLSRNTLEARAEPEWSSGEFDYQISYEAASAKDEKVMMRLCSTVGHSTFQIALL